MHSHDLGPWQHAHDFASDRRAIERRAWIVVAITLATMAAEIGAGWWWNSMALLADGWHMGTHALAIGVTGLSYRLVRRWSRDARFSLGPWKVEVLGAYTSAVLLAVVAAGVMIESVARLYRPQPVGYDESLAIATLGLVVNLVCARLLHGHGDRHDHHDHHDHHGHHGHDHPHDPAQVHDATAAQHHHGHTHAHAHAHAEADGPARQHTGRDLNREAAYTHVLADAATSVLAIGALVAGKWMGWLALDPLVGVVGAALIAWWARGLIVQSGAILLDREMDHPIATELRRRLESDGDAKVADLHLWRIGGESFACAVTLVAGAPASPDAYRARLGGLPGLGHVTIEINRCASPTHGNAARP